MELIIDTSSRYAAVGLSDDGRSLIELYWRSERNHSVELAPAINRILEQARIGIPDLDAVITADGPGAFSALRVGMSAAKAIAAARSIPLATVGTLDAEMQPYRALGIPLCAIASAGRNRLYVGRSDDKGAGCDLEVQSIAEFLDDVSIGASGGASGGAFYCGESSAELADDIERGSGGGALICRAYPPTRRVSSISSIGYDKLRSGETSDPAAAEPVYLRSSQVASANRRWRGF